MLTQFTTPLIEKKEAFKAALQTSEGVSYFSLLKLGFETIKNDDYMFPNYEHITVVDRGEYQGTMLFVIPGGGYQPYEHYITYVGYGSCSGCDTLQAIVEYKDNEQFTNEQLEELFTLTLHMFQRMIKFPDYESENKE